MYNIIIKGKNIELTGVITSYINKRMKRLSKFLQHVDTQVEVEVTDTTNHHKNGDIYKAEIRITTSGENFFASATGESVHAAIDIVQDEMARTLRRTKGRKQTLFKRGALSIKKMLKGLTKRNPETSRYDN